MRPARVPSSSVRSAGKGSAFPPLAPGAELVILAGDLAPVHTGRVGDVAISQERRRRA